MTPLNALWLQSLTPSLPALSDINITALNASALALKKNASMLIATANITTNHHIDQRTQSHLVRQLLCIVCQSPSAHRFFNAVLHNRAPKPTNTKITASTHDTNAFYAKNSGSKRHLNTNLNTDLCLFNSDVYDEPNANAHQNLSVVKKIVADDVLPNNFNLCCQFYQNSYPYFLQYPVQNNGAQNTHFAKYYVCFSHSATQMDDNTNLMLALVISPNICAIDIEQQDVKCSIVRRFFHSNEIAKLQLLDAPTRAHAKKGLWRLKECLIKAQNSTLTLGMTQDLSFIFTDIITPPPHTFAFTHKNMPYIAHIDGAYTAIMHA